MVDRLDLAPGDRVLAIETERGILLMRRIHVDTSAAIAILTREPDREELMRQLGASDPRLISAGTLSIVRWKGGAAMAGAGAGS